MTDWSMSTDQFWDQLSEMSTRKLIEKGWKRSPVHVGDLRIPVPSDGPLTDSSTKVVLIDQCQAYVVWEHWAIGFELTGQYELWMARASAVDTRWMNPSRHIVRCCARMDPRMIVSARFHPVATMNGIWDELPRRARKKLT